MNSNAVETYLRALEVRARKSSKQFQPIKRYRDSQMHIFSVSDDENSALAGIQSGAITK